MLPATDFNTFDVEVRNYLRPVPGISRQGQLLLFAETVELRRRDSGILAWSLDGYTREALERHIDFPRVTLTSPSGTYRRPRTSSEQQAFADELMVGGQLTTLCAIQRRSADGAITRLWLRTDLGWIPGDVMDVEGVLDRLKQCDRHVLVE